MFNYNFERGNVNNPARVYVSDDALVLAEIRQEGDQKFLAKDIEENLPNRKFKVICNGDSLLVCFLEELTAGEQTTLTTTIQNHKDNT